MSIAAVPLDSAAVRPVNAPAGAPLSAIIRSPTEEVYNETADMSFGDFLDMINPLQHIPVVGTIYRAVTGDTIKPAAQVIGGIAFGGPVGGIGAIFSAIIGQANGRSLEDSMLAGMGLGGEHPTTAVAEVPAAPAPQAAPVAAAAAAAPAPAVAAAAAAAQPLVQTAAATPLAQPVAQPVAQAAAPPRADKAASPIGDHKPSRMPVRDTMLATSLQSKNAAAIAQKSRPQAPAAPVLNPGTASVANANTSAVNTPAANAPAAVPPEMISDVMMRNLAKYEAAKKALNPTPPSIRTAS